MTDAECKQIVDISKQLEQLASAKITIQENPRAYLGIHYRPDFIWSHGDIKILEFSLERRKIAEQWIDEDLKKLQEELKRL